MKALPIRLRLTAAFAGAMVVVLVAAGAFVYLRLRADLDEAIDAGLEARWEAAGAHVADTGGLAGFPVEEPEEAAVQLVASNGDVIDQVGLVRRPILTDDERTLADTAGSVVLEKMVEGIEGKARLVARPVGDRLLVVALSLENRDDALTDLLVSFLVGGPVAVAVASVAGYGLARSGLAPVAAIQETAADITRSGDGRRLPVPETHDEIRRLAETLNAMLDRLERSFERERQFVADASHELRTPIAVVKTELEAALLAGDDAGAVRVSVRAAIDELDGLAHLADDLLVIARTVDSGLPLAKMKVEVSTLLEDVRHRFEDRAARHGRDIRVTGSVTGSAVVDPMRIRQALSNLVDNALRHGAGDITITATRDAGMIHLDVSDEGGGFGPDIAGRAFDRFARGDRSRSRGGVGLGLAIVEAIAQAHGGTARIVEGRPTTVRISLS